MDPAADICVGCGRTRREIAGWLGMSLADRAATNARARTRLALIGPTAKEVVPGGKD
jgi:predicted Fe-S protein YdhL (DUF1289 family)